MAKKNKRHVMAHQFLLSQLQTELRSTHRLRHTRIIEFELKKTRLRRSRSKADLKELMDGIRGQRLKILVVDDMPDVGEIMKDWLAFEFGAEVNVVDSGRAAIDDVNQNSYNCIFLDLMMPDMDGVETFLKLKDFIKRECIVLMSADPDCPEWEKAVKLGLSPIPKPIDDKKEDVANILFGCQGQTS